MMGIYKIENLINGKIYIGQSVDIHERWLEHKRVNERTSALDKQQYPLYRSFKKYGLENFSFEILEECSRDKLNEREKYWIAYYHTYINDPNNNGYNLTIGGEGKQFITDEEIQNFIDLWHQDLSVGEIALITERSNKVVIKYLKQCCNDYNIEEGRKRGANNSGKNHTKSINQYDLLGNLIQSYNSIIEAAQELGISSATLINNAKHKTTTCHDFFFFYANEDLEQNLRIHYTLPKFQEPVIQLDANNNPINCFSSAALAAKNFRYMTKDTRQKGSAIIDCCKGNAKSAYGYKWKFLEYEDIEKYNLREIGMKTKNDDVCCYFCEDKIRKNGTVFSTYACNDNRELIEQEYFNLYYCPVCGKKILNQKE